MWRIVNTLTRGPATVQSLTSVRPASTSQSDIHTDRLYPGTSSNDRFKPVSPPEQDPQSLHFNGYIPVNEVQIRSMPGSSGPGGQNVNKSATKVEIRFNVEKANWLSDPIKQVNEFPLLTWFQFVMWKIILGPFGEMEPFATQQRRGIYCQVRQNAVSVSQSSRCFVSCHRQKEAVPIINCCAFSGRSCDMR